MLSLMTITFASKSSIKEIHVMCVVLIANREERSRLRGGRQGRHLTLFALAEGCHSFPYCTLLPSASQAGAGLREKARWKAVGQFLHL